MEKNIKDYLPYYIGQQAMTPDGIGTIVGLPWQIQSQDRVSIHFGKCIHTKNSIDGGYDKRRNHGAYAIEEKHYEALATSDPEFSSFTMPGGVKPILRKLQSMTEEEGIELAKIHKYDIPEDEGVRQELIDIYTFDDGLLRIGTTYLPGKMFIEGFRYLLSKGFDLFGLLESGLAIEKQPTTKNQGV